MGSWKRLAPGRFGWALLLGVLVLAGGQALAQDDPPGRVGRIAMLQGAASVFDAELAQWVDATVNLPVTQHDRLVTGNDGRLELRIGSTTLYLDASTEVQAVRLGLRIKEVAVPRVYLDPNRAFGGVLNDQTERLAYYRRVIDDADRETSHLAHVWCPELREICR